ncbi:hypothetical protein MTO96_052354 [Rhipicephalus appendiculatus]
MSQPDSCLPDTLSMPAAYKRHERDLRRSEDFVAGLRERAGLVAGDRPSGELWKSKIPATAESIRQSGQESRGLCRGPPRKFVAVDNATALSQCLAPSRHRLARGQRRPVEGGA